MGLRKYFSGISEAVKTIGEGMAVTASHLLRKPVTLLEVDLVVGTRRGDVRVCVTRGSPLGICGHRARDRN